MSFQRPFNSTSNPKWMDAETPLDLIPETDDPTGNGQRMVDLVGMALVTQGDHAGMRFGEVMLPWQEAYIRYLFGATDENGDRLVNRSFLKVGKGNGKTSMLSFISLGVVMAHAADGTAQRGVLMIISATLATANICFSHILEAVKNDPELAKEFKSNATKRQLVHVESGIVIQVSSAKMSDTVGRRIFCLIVDETHLASLECRDFSSIIDQARRGGLNFGKRFLEVHISTAPPSVSTGLYSELLGYSRKVRDGADDPNFFPVLFEFPVKKKGIQIDDPTEWWRGCPSATDGGPLALSSLADEYNESIKTGIERDLALFLSQRLGVEPRDNKAAGVSPLREFWHVLPDPEDAGAFPDVISLDPSSGADDPFAISYMWREGDAVAFRVRQHLTRHGYDRAGDALRATYDAAIAAGELILSNSSTEMTDAVIAEILGFSDQGTVVVGGDAYGLTGFVQQIEEKLWNEYVSVAQGWKLLKSLELMDALALDRRLRPVKTPLLSANVDNMVLENGPKGRTFAKRDAGLSGQGQAKFDGLMASLSAIELLYEHASYNTFDVAAYIG